LGSHENTRKQPISLNIRGIATWRVFELAALQSDLDNFSESVGPTNESNCDMLSEYIKKYFIFKENKVSHKTTTNSLLGHVKEFLLPLSSMNLMHNCIGKEGLKSFSGFFLGFSS
jgi:hypothetical protein